jgi:hypothetical protein
MAQPKDQRLRRFVLIVGALAAGLVGYSAFRGGKIMHGEDGAAAEAVAVADARIPDKVEAR